MSTLNEIEISLQMGTIKLAKVGDRRTIMETEDMEELNSLVGR